MMLIMNNEANLASTIDFDYRASIILRSKNEILSSKNLIASKFCETNVCQFSAKCVISSSS